MPSSFRWKAAFIILIAILVRFAFVVAVDSGKVRFEHNPDAEDYLSFAHNLATGGDSRTPSTRTNRFPSRWSFPPGGRHSTLLERYRRSRVKAINSQRL